MSKYGFRLVHFLRRVECGTRCEMRFVVLLTAQRKYLKGCDCADLRLSFLRGFLFVVRGPANMCFVNIPCIVKYCIRIAQDFRQTQQLCSLTPNMFAKLNSPCFRRYFNRCKRSINMRVKFKSRDINRFSRQTVPKEL